MANFTDWSYLDSINFSFTKKDGKNYTNYNCQNIMSFDIECSNGFLMPDGYVHGFSHKKVLSNPCYYDTCAKLSLMYVWQFGLDNDKDIPVFHGRTWDSFENFLYELSKRVVFKFKMPEKEYSDDGYEIVERHLTKSDRINVRIYIHNLGYEFQHLRNLFEKQFVKNSRYKSSVFARSERSPMKFGIRIGKVNFEFRDSYCLTGMSLKAWTKDLPVAKLSEPDWFYLPVLTPNTPLSQDRIDYSINDVVSMVYGLRKYKEEFEDYFNIPLTQTGIVRRKAVETVCKNTEYIEHCAEVTGAITFESYIDLVDLFAGGWTHANKKYSDRFLKNITCYDFASSYPACMTTRTFPYSSFELVDPEEYDDLLNQNLKDNNLKYHYWLEFEAEEVKSTVWNTWWSTSKTIEIRGETSDNGKIHYADYVRIKMTDLDFDTFKKTYKYTKLNIIRMYKSESRHLPVELINLILGWYSVKTSYKEVEGKEDEYNSSKRYINSIYGCMVTKTFTDEVAFTIWDNMPLSADVLSETFTGWKTFEMDERSYYDKLSKEIKKGQMWTMYQTGVWVTAWARHNLFDAILEMDGLVCYSDTDSVKGIFTDKEIKWFEEYNKEILDLHQYMADTYGIDINLYRPKTPTGKVKPLGIFADDGFYKEFKTLGAKRYCSLEYNEKTGKDEIHTTIAGLPKEAGAKKITELGGVSAFNNHITWNSKESNKLISYYNDNQLPNMLWIDKDGNGYESSDKYGLCLMPTSFDMSLSDDYEAFIALIHGDTKSGYFENYSSFYKKHLTGVV